MTYLFRDLSDEYDLRYFLTTIFGIFCMCFEFDLLLTKSMNSDIIQTFPEVTEVLTIYNQKENYSH